MKRPRIERLDEFFTARIAIVHDLDYQEPSSPRTARYSRRAVRAYLRHFWSHWSGPAFEPDNRRLDHLVEVYGPPDALTARSAGIGPGRALWPPPWPSGRPPPLEPIAVPTTVLWPEHDPPFLRAWSDRLGEFCSAAELEWLDRVGFFTPVEGPQAFAAAIGRAAMG